MADPIFPAPLRRHGAKGGRRNSITFRASVRLDTSMVRDLRTPRGTTAQLQTRRAIRQSARRRF